MKLKLIIAFLVFTLCGCYLNVNVHLNKNYRGWVFIIAAKNIKQYKKEITPDSNGVAYISTAQFIERKHLNLIVGGKDVTAEHAHIIIANGLYESHNKEINYVQFYFPKEYVYEDSLHGYKDTINGHLSGKLLDHFDYLLSKGKIDTTLIWSR